MTKVCLVGVFPPPVVGLSMVNELMAQRLRDRGATAAIIDLSSGSTSRSIRTVVSRAGRGIWGLMRLGMWLIKGGRSVYMSASGGSGQLYEIGFAVLGRLFGARVFVHHHSYAYLTERRLITHFFLKAAGKRAVHVALCADMASQLRRLYQVNHVVVVSNAALVAQPRNALTERRELRTIGFLSNISWDKGIEDFISVAKHWCSADSGHKALVAGPVADKATKEWLAKQVDSVEGLQYLGARYGTEKQGFFRDIDVLLFPTKYINEAEPLTIYEAMANGVPVIAYGRGCIGTMLGRLNGATVDPEIKFCAAAIQQLDRWVLRRSDFEMASAGVLSRYESTFTEGECALEKLLGDIMWREKARASAHVQ